VDTETAPGLCTGYVPVWSVTQIDTTVSATFVLYSAMVGCPLLPLADRLMGLCLIDDEDDNREEVGESG